MGEAASRLAHLQLCRHRSPRVAAHQLRQVQTAVADKVLDNDLDRVVRQANDETRLLRSTWLSTLSSACRFHSALSTSTLKCFSTVCQRHGSGEVVEWREGARTARLAQFANNSGELLGGCGAAGHRGIAHLLQACA
jgi:hypothetical protein